MIHVRFRRLTFIATIKWSAIWLPLACANQTPITPLLSSDKVSSSSKYFDDFKGAIDGGKTLLLLPYHSSKIDIVRMLKLTENIGSIFDIHNQFENVTSFTPKLNIKGMDPVLSLELLLSICKQLANPLQAILKTDRDDLLGDVAQNLSDKEFADVVNARDTGVSVVDLPNHIKQHVVSEISNRALKTISDRFKRLTILLGEPEKILLSRTSTEIEGKKQYSFRLSYNSVQGSKNSFPLSQEFYPEVSMDNWSAFEAEYGSQLPKYRFERLTVNELASRISLNDGMKVECSSELAEQAIYYRPGTASAKSIFGAVAELFGAKIVRTGNVYRIGRLALAGSTEPTAIALNIRRALGPMVLTFTGYEMAEFGTKNPLPLPLSKRIRLSEKSHFAAERLSFVQQHWRDELIHRTMQAFGKSDRVSWKSLDAESQHDILGLSLLTCLVTPSGVLSWIDGTVSPLEINPLGSVLHIYEDGRIGYSMKEYDEGLVNKMSMSTMLPSVAQRVANLRQRGILH